MDTNRIALYLLYGICFLLFANRHIYGVHIYVARWRSFAVYV